MLGLLALVFLLVSPVLSASGAKSHAVQCLVNLQQLMRAMTLYTTDHAGLFPPNPDDANTLPGHNWCPGNAGPGGPQEFNPDLLADIARCLVAPYLGGELQVFRCTSDPRTGVYRGTDLAKQGQIIPAVRSLAMNGAVGSICPGFDNAGGHQGVPTLSVNGPWLDNSHAHRRNRPWRTYGNTAEVVAPVPASLWVLIEEDPSSLNDGAFAFGMNHAEWLDWPGTAHDFCGAMAFADGHSELHKWKDSRTRILGGMVSRRVVPGSEDWVWLSERTSARVP